TTASSPTFDANGGTITFDGGYGADTSIDASGITFNSVILNRSFLRYANIGLTIANGTNLPLGTVTLFNTYHSNLYFLTNNGTITVSDASWSTSVEAFTNNGTITALDITSWTMTGDFTNGATGIINMPSCTTFDFNLYEEWSSKGSFTNSSGASFTADSNPVFNIEGNFIVSGTSTFLPATDVTLHLDGGSRIDATVNAPNITFIDPVTINRTCNYGAPYSVTIASGTTLPLDTVTLSNNSEAYSLINEGAITVSDTSWSLSIDGTFTNSGTITATSLTSWDMNGNFTNADGGEVDMSSCASFDFDSYGNGKGHFTNSSGASFTADANPTFNLGAGFVIDSESTLSPDTDVILAIDGSSGVSSSIDAPGITFVDPVTINCTPDVGAYLTLTIASGTTLPLGTVTLNNIWGNPAYSLINEGAITVSDTSWSVSVDGTFTNYGTITATSLTSWDMNGNFINADGGVVNMSSCTAFDFDTYGNSSTVGFTNSSGASFTAAADPSFATSGSFIVSGTSTFLPLTGITLALGGSAGASSSVDASTITFFDPVTINRDFYKGAYLTLTIASGTTLPLDTVTLNNTWGNPAYSLTNNGEITVSAAGDWSVSVDGTFTNSGTITSSNLTSWTMGGSFTNADGGSVDMPSCSAFDFNNYGNSAGDFTNSAGSSLASAATPSFNALANVTVSSSSTFPALGTFTLDRTSSTQTLNAPSLTCTSFVKNQGSSLTLSSGFAAGGFTFSGGTISNPASAYTITVSDAFLQSSANTLGGGNLTLEFTGSDPQTIEKTAGTFSSIVDVDKAGDAATLLSAFAAGDNFTITQGTVATAGFALTVSGTFSNYGTLKLYGNEAHSPPTNYPGSLV
ncbi:beta strand repeat-containing protein, partial [Candidatus Omnitrophota bacterium]